TAPPGGRARPAGADDSATAAATATAAARRGLLTGATLCLFASPALALLARLALGFDAGLVAGERLRGPVFEGGELRVELDLAGLLLGQGGFCGIRRLLSLDHLL